MSAAGHELRGPRLHAPPGHALRLRIRARDVSLAVGTPRGLSFRNTLPGTVVEIRAETGPFAEVRVDIGGAALIARITRDAVADLDLAPGRAVHALVKTVSFDRRSRSHVE